MAHSTVFLQQFEAATQNFWQRHQQNMDLGTKRGENTCPKNVMKIPEDNLTDAHVPLMHNYFTF